MPEAFCYETLGLGSLFLQRLDYRKKEVRSSWLEYSIRVFRLRLEDFIVITTHVLE